MTDFPRKPTANYLKPKSFEIKLNVSADDEPPTERLTPADEMETEKEAPRMISPEMKTDRMTMRVTSLPGEMGVPHMHDGAADAVLVEDKATPVEAAPAAQTAIPDAHRIAEVKAKITQIDAAHQTPATPTQKNHEMQLEDDKRHFNTLTQTIAETQAEIAKRSPNVSTGFFLVRAWNSLMRRIDQADRKEAEGRLAVQEKQLASIVARHPEFAKPKLTVVPSAAHDVAAPKSRWSTTEATKTLYTVEQKQVRTRFENLQRTIRAKQELVTRLEKTEPRSATTRYEQNALTRLSAELDTVYNQNKTFIDSLPDDEPVEAKNRA